MRAKQLIRELDHLQITTAIAGAEKHTTGEIHVYVSHRRVHDPRRAAAHQFVKMKLDKIRQQNAVLIFIAPESRNFSIMGGDAIHARCGEQFWQDVVLAMREYFRRGEFTEGVVHGISTAGKLLAEHFPRETKS